jgi:glycosyltransferase involved in cell wall biosynthesis
MLSLRLQKMNSEFKINKRKRILVLCPFPVGVAASQRLKYEQYFDDWHSFGYVVEISAFMDMRMWKIVYSPGCYCEKIFGFFRGQIRRLGDVFRVAQYDLVYIHMWVTPFGSSIFERYVLKHAKKVIYDLEDNVVLQPSGVLNKDHPNRWLSRLKGSGKVKCLIKNADYVITSSPFLNELCLEINSRKACTYISSSVDTDRFIPVSRYFNTDSVIIGWTGTFSSKIYLEILRNVFLTLASRVEFKLKVIGNFDYELPGVDLEVIRWTRETEVEDLQTIDIGVYPLPIDNWVLGKSGLKAIQYMAFGLPVVATNVGTTPLLISHEVDGLLVNSQEEWVCALERLVCEPDLRRKLGQAARLKAIQKYSIRSVKQEYRNVLQFVTEDRKV